MSRIRLDVATPTGIVTNEDRVFFTKPWYITRTFTPARTGDRMTAYTCTENNPNQPNLGYKHQPTP